jgi:hypothetical protein
VEAGASRLLLALQRTICVLSRIPLIPRPFSRTTWALRSGSIRRLPDHLRTAETSDVGALRDPTNQDQPRDRRRWFHLGAPEADATRSRSVGFSERGGHVQASLTTSAGATSVPSLIADERTENPVFARAPWGRRAPGCGRRAPFAMTSAMPAVGINLAWSTRVSSPRACTASSARPEMITGTRSTGARAREAVLVDRRQYGPVESARCRHPAYPWMVTGQSSGVLRCSPELVTKVLGSRGRNRARITQEKPNEDHARSAHIGVIVLG